MSEPFQEADASPLAKRLKLDEESKEIFSPSVNLVGVQKTALWSRLNAYKSLCDLLSAEYERLLGIQPATLVDEDLKNYISYDKKQFSLEIVKLKHQISTAPTAEPTTSPSAIVSEPAANAGDLDSYKAEMEAINNLLKIRTASLEKVSQEKIQLEYELSIAKSRSVDSSAKVELSRIKNELDCSLEKIRRLEMEIDRLFKKRHDFLEEKEEDQVTKFGKTLDNLQREITRYRKERDEMREMYESANGQVSSLNKHCTHLQIMVDSLKSKIQILESKDKKLSDALAGTSYSEDAFLAELETIGSAFQSLQNHNQQLLKDISEKEGMLQAVNADKIKLEFKLSQILKDAEVSTKRAEEMEKAALSKVSTSISKEKLLQTSVLNLEKELVEKAKLIEDLKRKISEQSLISNELDRNLRHLKADLEEPIFCDLRRRYDRNVADLNRLKEDNDLLEKKYNALKRRQQSGNTEAEEELQLYKKLLKCNSCHVREKNAVLTKCMHVFCRTCLEERVETRQRKCPNCGEAFSATDIRNIYL